MEKNTFLQVAEIILREKGSPMSAEEILLSAIGEGLLTTKGKTPELSMKARLSTDIIDKKFSSKFMRTGKNKFALREFEMQEYIATPFKKKIPNETVTCISQADLLKIDNNFGFYLDEKRVKEILALENLTFIERYIAENDSNYKQLISYVLLVTRKNEVLTYRRGVYTNAHDMLKGSACLGFGGHVQKFDTTNMFSKGVGGVYDTAEREVHEELKGFIPENLELLGYINDDSSPEGVKHLGIVLKGLLPDDFNLNNFGVELSINDLKFMSIKEVWAQFYEFEFWSQLLIRKLFTSSCLYKKVIIKPSKFKINSNIIVFVGEIASGKTILCDILQKEHNFKSISTRKCVAKLINHKDFGVDERKEFQKKASLFIKEKDGPFKLAKEINKEAQKLKGTILIDGIRHFETLLELRKFFPDLVLIYVDTTRDDAYRNYKERGLGKATIHQFREVRHHPVEGEITLIKGDADAYIFNGGNKDELYNEFIHWFNSNK